MIGIQCEQCGVLVQPTDARQRYCSRKCNNRAWYLRNHLEGVAYDEDPSPNVWDGTTKYNDLPQLYWFRKYCISCGADSWVRTTRAHVQAMRALSPCVVCGGARWIEDDFNSRMGSTLHTNGYADAWHVLEAAV